MQLQFLITSEQRASGAMFRESVNDTVLAFIYPTDGGRTFHTFLCPPMRIIALSADGQVLFDEVTTKWGWVKLPVCSNRLAESISKRHIRKRSGFQALLANPQPGLVIQAFWAGGDPVCCAGHRR